MRPTGASAGGRGTGRRSGCEGTPRQPSSPPPVTLAATPKLDLPFAAIVPNLTGPLTGFARRERVQDGSEGQAPQNGMCRESRVTLAKPGGYASWIAMTQEPGRGVGGRAVPINKALVDPEHGNWESEATSSFPDTYSVKMQLHAKTTVAAAFICVCKTFNNPEDGTAKINKTTFQKWRKCNIFLKW